MLVSLWFVWILDPYLLGVGEVSRVMSACHCCAWWKVMQSHVSLSLLFMMEGDDGLALFQVALLSLWPHSILSCFGFCWNWPECQFTFMLLYRYFCKSHRCVADQGPRRWLIMSVVSFKLLLNCLSCVVLLVTSWQLCSSLHVAAEESPIEYSSMNSYIVCDLDLRNNISWKLVTVSATEYWLHFYAVVVVVPWFGEECCELPMLCLCHATFRMSCRF